MSKFKIDDKVFAVFSSWCEGIAEGVIEDIDMIDDPKTHKQVLCYRVNRKNKMQAAPDAYLEENLFETEDEAKASLKKRHDDAIAAYCNEITDISSLVSFCMNKCVGPAEEYTDNDAREAVKIKAKEFGLKLNID